jgi:murein DD-endopeptidase MepM/ murein hydrolase activator NlpD
VAVALAASLATAAPATATPAAQPPGAPATAPAQTPAGAPPGSTGGASFQEAPRLRRVSCRRRCDGPARARPNSIVRIRGTGLRTVTRVVFHGAPGAADDVLARVRPSSDRRLSVRVPAAAVTGPVSLVAGRLATAPTRRSLEIVPLEEADTEVTALAPPGVLRPVSGPRDPGAPGLETGLSRGKVFLGAADGVTLTYRVVDAQPVTVQVQLVRLGDGAVVQTWDAPSVPAGQPQAVSWKGSAAGVVQPEGRYAFRITARGSGGAQAHSSQATDVTRDSFDLYGHIFPVRGRHDYGDDGARFGSGRGGRGHQGHDVFAACGTRLVAARGGVVKFKQYHAAAGHYVVIDGDDTDVDYAYMHLQSPPPVQVGRRVYTGQLLGAVGDSGNASGCHLHFEMWNAPGWYDGGGPFDPLPHLQAWDAAS